MYAAEGELQKSLNAAIKLTTYHHRWYMDSAYPSLVASWIYKLGLEHGHAKIQYTLLSMVRTFLRLLHVRVFLCDLWQKG